jgi:hypothetical protein
MAIFHVKSKAKNDSGIGGQQRLRSTSSLVSAEILRQATDLLHFWDQQGEKGVSAVANDTISRLLISFLPKQLARVSQGVEYFKRYMMELLNNEGKLISQGSAEPKIS